MEEYAKTTNYLEKLGHVGGVVIALGCILFLWRRPMEQAQYANLHLLGVFFIYPFLLYYERSVTDRRDRAVFGLLFASFLVGLVGTLYVQVFFETLRVDRFGQFTTVDLIAGVMIILGVLIATYYSYGWIVAGLGVVSILFAYFGPFLPGIFGHPGQSAFRIIVSSTVDFSGIYHQVFQIAATWIFIFVIWAGIVERFGGLDSFINIGLWIGSPFKSGVAQTAVIGSMFMGSINGSPLANIAVTGSFTIPLMERWGLESDVAASIETVASTGGMILPPVMGSVAFLMVVFLPYNYGEIVVMAALPAALFMLAVAISVHWTVIRQQLKSESSAVDFDFDARETELDFDKRETLTSLVPVAISLGALIYMLVVYGWSPGIAGVYTIAILLVCQFGLGLARREPLSEFARDFVRNVLDGLSTGTYRMVPISVVLGMMGMAITLFIRTGIGYRLSFEVVAIAGGVTIVLLVLVGLSSLILGMGMPIPAAYLLVVTLVAPALVDSGFEDVTAHFFVFYFAIMATMTPPIALGAAVAARIADADFITVAFKAVRIGAPLFILPFIFVYNEEIIILSGMQTMIAFVSAAIGLSLISYGFNRPVFERRDYGMMAGYVAVGFLVAFEGANLVGLLF